MKRHWLVGTLLVLGAGCDAVLGIEQAPALQAELECRVWTCTGKSPCGYVNKSFGTRCSAGACDSAGECRLALGASCTDSSQCSTDQCMDGVCCDEACTGSCKVCNASGKCVNVASGVQDNNPVDTACTAPKACTGSGDCKGASGQECFDGTDCVTGHCVDGICCNTECTESCKACNLAGSVGTCSNISQGKQDYYPFQACAGASLACDGQGACKGIQGTQCFGNGSECLSGYCADGVCCDTACAGMCMACNLSGSPGTCLNIPSGQDTNAAQTCAESGDTCDGFGNCKSTNGYACVNQSDCLSGHCVDGVCCNEQCQGLCRACSGQKKGWGGDGVCGFVAGYVDQDQECQYGACDGAGVCKKDNGQACTQNGDCLSGHCVEGVCCNTACTGTCMACTAALKGQGSNGLCQNIALNLDPQNECSYGACGGTGTCKLDITRPCTTNADCLSNSCSGGVCTGPSCIGLANTCGYGNNESCCKSNNITGDTFNRINNANYPATVSDFYLDRFEVTTGRFRRFVEAYPASKPTAGAGAHPEIPGSGWKVTWNSQLPTDKAMLTSNLKACFPATWTDVAGAQEQLPINCISWAVAFAFCAWDGGRLPTEAEWNYAAARGSAQYIYPWTKTDTYVYSHHASFNCMGDGDTTTCTLADILPVGSRPNGNGGWGHADLGGSMWEWTLDVYSGTFPMPCIDCANLTGGSGRIARGGSWLSKPASCWNCAGVPELMTTSRSWAPELQAVGVRCARTPPPP